MSISSDFLVSNLCCFQMQPAALHDGTDPLVLVRMAAVDFYFAAAHAEVLVTQMRGISKAEAAIALRLRSSLSEAPLMAAP